MATNLDQQITQNVPEFFFIVVHIGSDISHYSPDQKFRPVINYARTF